MSTNPDIQAAMKSYTQHLQRAAKDQREYQEKMRDTKWQELTVGAAGVNELVKGLNIMGPALGIVMGRINEGTSAERFRAMLALLNLLNSATVKNMITDVGNALKVIFKFSTWVSGLIKDIFSAADTFFFPPPYIPSPGPTTPNDPYFGYNDWKTGLGGETEKPDSEKEWWELGWDAFVKGLSGFLGW